MVPRERNRVDEQRLQVAAAFAHDLMIVALALDPVVPGKILVMAVAVPLAIGLVVLAFVGVQGRRAKSRHAPQRN